MPYTAAQLATIYTNTQAGIAPSAAITAVLNSYATQNSNGTLTDQQVLSAVIALANPTSAVAITTYQFFTGTAPTAAGLAFLVNSPTNPNDLNDPYYAQFNTVNRYINFSANLGTGGGAGAAAFQSAYGSLSLTDTVATAYETIIGSGNAVAAGFDPAAGRAYIASQIPYFQTFARQNNPTATAAQLDLIVKAEIVGYTLEEAVKSGLGTYANATQQLLADLGPDNTAFLGASIFANYGANQGAVTLTLNTDVLSANVFNAPLATSSTGDTRANTLQDEDQLVGVGTNPTLNFTFGNPGLNGGTTVTPSLRGIQTVNVSFTGSGVFSQGGGGLNILPNPTLDLQDATGVQALNITRISGTNTSVSVVNLQAEPTISVTDTNAPATTVFVNTVDQALAGAADKASITLNSAQVAGLVNRSGTGLGVSNTGGVEFATLVSSAGTSGYTNYVGEFNTPGLQTLTITGTQSLELGTKNVTTSNLVNNGFFSANPTANALGQSEAARYGAAFANEAGTLNLVDASGFTGPTIAVDLGPEVTGTSVQNSGSPVNFTYKGSAGADTVRILGSVDASGDSIDGGAGANILAFYNQGTQSVAPAAAGTTAASTLTNFQALEIHAGTDVAVGAETISVNAAAITGLAAILVRDEGQAQATSATTVSGGALPSATGGLTTGQFYSAPEGTVTATITKLTAAQGAAITVQHSTTGNNAIAGATLGGPSVPGAFNNDFGVGSTGFGSNTGLILNPVLGANSASDTIALTIQQQLNTDPRFNFTLTAGSAVNTIENLTITDSDNESNTVALTRFADHTGTIIIKGGSAGTFFNLDSTADLYQLDEGGLQNDGVINGIVQVGGNYTSPTAQGTVYNPGGVRDAGVGAAERLIATTIDASAEISDVLVRVGEGAGTTTGAQTILMGSGNDTVIFDQLSVAGAPAQTAGLSISDTVKGGAGLDTLVIDGDVSTLPAASQHINIGASEWTNVSGFETLRLVGDGTSNANPNSNGTGGDKSKLGELASDLGGNAYNLTLTNDFINANSVNTGGINRIAIINDNDPQTDATRTTGVAGTVANGVVNVNTGLERGVTIDARTLVATNSFTYNGEEGADAAAGGGGGKFSTADRFILADANINGSAIINGGAILNTNALTNNSGNNDVLEARNGSVVTIGDLANTSNVGTLEFTNDTAITQASTLQLDSATVDRLVNTYHTATTVNTERLTIHAIDNQTVTGATTSLSLDASQVTGGVYGLDVLVGRGVNTITTSDGNDVITELGNYNTGTYAAVRAGGLVTAAGQDTNLNIDSLANNVAGVRNVTDTINGGAGIDNLVSYGNISYAGATITNVEAFTFNSNVTVTDKQLADAQAAAVASGYAGATITFTGAGPHTLTVVHQAGYTGPAADISSTKIVSATPANTTVYLGSGASTTGTLNPTTSGSLGPSIYTPVLTDSVNDGITNYGNLQPEYVNFNQSLASVTASKVHIYDTTNGVTTEVAQSAYTVALAPNPAFIQVNFNNGIADNHNYTFAFEAGAGTYSGGGTTPLIGQGNVNFTADT